MIKIYKSHSTVRCYLYVVISEDEYYKYELATKKWCIGDNPNGPANLAASAATVISATEAVKLLDYIP